MKKKHVKQNRIPVTIPENSQRFWISYGFNFFVQALQLGIGGVAMCAPIALLYPKDRDIIPLLLQVCALAPLLCGLICWIESLVKKRHGTPMVGIDGESIYLRDGMGMILRMDEIIAIHYSFSQFRKFGKPSYLQLYPKKGALMSIIHPSPSLIWAVRKAIPSVKITVNWVSHLIVCFLMGFTVGLLMSLLFLMQ